MATIWVDARSGSDANDGLSQANAKKTFQAAITAAGNGGVINAVGVFKEIVTNNSGSQTWNAIGFAIFDGDGVLANGLTFGNAELTINDFIFKNHTTAGILWGINGVNTLRCNDCVFEDEVIGVRYSVGDKFTVFTRCIFRDCTTGFDHLGSNTTRTHFFKNCTFVGCGTGQKMVVDPSDESTLNNQNSIFSHNTVHIDIDEADRVSAAVCNFNCIDFASGKCIINSVDKLTLSAWQTDVAPADTRTISVDPLYVDRLKRLHGLLPASVCHKAGSLAFGTQVQGAILKQCEGVSTNRNGTEWTGATLVDVIINGNGDLELDTGMTVGTATITHDFGTGRDSSKLYVEHDDDFTAAILDFDKSDTLPETWEVRVADSDDDISYSAFVEVNLMRPALSISNRRYHRVEITLRKDA